jgi:hypothetical protein
VSADSLFSVREHRAAGLPRVPGGTAGLLSRISHVGSRAADEVTATSVSGARGRVSMRRFADGLQGSNDSAQSTVGRPTDRKAAAIPAAAETRCRD